MWKKFLDKFWGENLSFETRLFHVTFFIAMLACMVGSISSYLRNISNVFVVVIGAVFLLLIALGIAVQKTRQFQKGSYITVIFMSVVIYPLLFIISGGINSKMPSLWVLIMVMAYFVSTDKKKLVCLLLGQTLLLIVLVLLEHVYPNIVLQAKSKEQLFLDIINSVIVAAIGIGTIVNFQKTIYLKEKQKVEVAIKEAKEANRAKSLFLANMSHEIRTPMNAILGMLELIVRDDISEEVREKANNMQNASVSLLSIINDILDFSKIESGKMDILLERYQFSTVICDIINIISIRLAQKDVELFVQIDPNIPNELIGDQLRVRQILINVLNNAVKFTSSGSITLTIGYRLREDCALLFVNVEDTGIGIRKENIGKIFLSFERVEEFEHRNIEGTGLGLSICKQLLSLMGGSITVQSEFGRGSNFSVLLPQKIVNKEPIVLVDNQIKRKVIILEKTNRHAQVLEQFLKPLAIETKIVESLEELKEVLQEESYTNLFISKGMFKQEQELICSYADKIKICIITDYNNPIKNSDKIITVRRPLWCMNLAAVLNNDLTRMNHSLDKQHRQFTAIGAEILVIDDNVINLEVIKGLLHYYHINVTVASSGKEGLILLEEAKYDLVLLDYMMPDMSGIQTLKQIRSKAPQYYKEVPVIALTATAVSGAREMFIQEGFQDYITKPIDVFHLEKILLHYLSNDVLQLDTTNEIDKKRQEWKQIKIEGIDTLEGMKHCNGLVENYQMILNIAVKEGRDKCSFLRSCLKMGNYERYVIEAHGIKGAMQSIGALELSEIAKNHEVAGKEENYEFIHKDIDSFLQHYEALCKEVEDYLELEKNNEKPMLPESEASAIKEEELIERIKEIEGLLQVFESSLAEEKITELLSCKLNQKSEMVMKKIKQQVEELDYDEALQLITSYLQEGRKLCINY